MQKIKTGNNLLFFDFLVFLVFASAFIASRVSYDPATAQIKFWFVAGSVLFYYALSRFSKSYYIFFSIGMLVLGVGVAILFLLTHDFVISPRKIDFINQVGLWWMGIRPRVDLPSIHPNYAAGVAVIASIYGFYLVKRMKDTHSLPFGMVVVLLLLGFIGILVVLATSRGVLMAIICVAGIWVLWWLYNKFKDKSLILEKYFTILITLYLIMIMVLVYLGPAQGFEISGAQADFGTSSRAELFQRSLYLVSDFPFSGGGLNTFPGLFSQYILVIPYFFLPNSHNLFMDVAIEQGVWGGIAFFLLYVGSIWIVTKALVRNLPSNTHFFTWATLLALFITIVHGMVDNYLYNGAGALLSMVFVGVAVNIYNQAETGGQAGLEKYKGGAIINAASRVTVFKILIPSLGVILLVLGLVFGWKIRSAFYANLGAVQLSKIELNGFPHNSWSSGWDITQLHQPEVAFVKSLHIDPSNSTANYRLGLIDMKRQNFQTAAGYLETALQKKPNHRGILKNLGFCYVWLGNFDRAKTLLSGIGEADDELDVYTWWWKDQGRPELSLRAKEMLDILDTR